MVAQKKQTANPGQSHSVAATSVGAGGTHALGPVEQMEPRLPLAAGCSSFVVIASAQQVLSIILESLMNKERVDGGVDAHRRLRHSRREGSKTQPTGNGDALATARYPHPSYPPPPLGCSPLSLPPKLSSAPTGYPSAPYPRHSHSNDPAHGGGEQQPCHLPHEPPTLP